MHSPSLRALLIVATLSAATMLAGCVVAGVTSGGHFFLFPSLGLILVLVIVFALLRRR